MTHDEFLTSMSVHLRHFRDANHAVQSKSEAWDFISYCLKNQHRSNSQLFQDLFVLYFSKELERGFFIEFGVCDGLRLSNTLLLEASYNWRGIVAEPAKCWHERLMRNRRAIISTDCVWSESGKTLSFNETSEAELSTVNEFSDRDGHSATRKSGSQYDVQTISLNDLLKKNNAPKIIDYLSIDTEGSEFSILNTFDFSYYEIRLITVEHNFTPDREKIHDLLTSKGYVRKFTQISAFDDWYVKL